MAFRTHFHLTEEQSDIIDSIFRSRNNSGTFIRNIQRLCKNFSEMNRLQGGNSQDTASTGPLNGLSSLSLATNRIARMQLKNHMESVLPQQISEFINSEVEIGPVRLFLQLQSLFSTRSDAKRDNEIFKLEIDTSTYQPFHVGTKKITISFLFDMGLICSLTVPYSSPLTPLNLPRRLLHVLSTIRDEEEEDLQLDILSTIPEWTDTGGYITPYSIISIYPLHIHTHSYFHDGPPISTIKEIARAKAMFYRDMLDKEVTLPLVAQGYNYQVHYERSLDICNFEVIGSVDFDFSMNEIELDCYEVSHWPSDDNESGAD